MKTVKILSILAFTFCLHIAKAQTLTTQLSVYFKSNKYLLPEVEKNRIDSLISFLADKDIQSIYLKGNTDSDADSLYNMKLSQKRSLSVKNYFIEKSYPNMLFQTAYFGENIPIASNSVDFGKQKNRRVDIIVFYKTQAEILEYQPISSNENPKNINPKPKTDTSNTAVSKEIAAVPIDTCLADTTIILPQGTRFVINTCDYLRYKDSIKITEYMTPESILDSDLTTVSSSNQQLQTSGMFNVQMSDSIKLKKPLMFLVPAQYGMLMRDPCTGRVDYRTMTLWTRNNDNTWGNSKKVKLVKKDDSTYYEFPIISSGYYNVDSPIFDQVSRNIKVKFKVKRGMQIEKIRVFQDGRIVESKIKDKNKRMIVFTFPKCPEVSCEKYMYVKAIAIDSKGYRYTSQKDLHEYKHHSIFLKCAIRKNRRKAEKIRFLKIGKVGVFSRYTLKKSDWKRNQPLVF